MQNDYEYLDDQDPRLRKGGFSKQSTISRKGQFEDTLGEGGKDFLGKKFAAKKKRQSNVPPQLEESLNDPLPMTQNELPNDLVYGGNDFKGKAMNKQEVAQVSTPHNL